MEEQEFKIGDCVMLNTNDKQQMSIESFDSAGNVKGAMCVWLANNEKKSAYFLLSSLKHCPKAGKILMGSNPKRNNTW